jgi:hypothetical protein
MNRITTALKNPVVLFLSTILTAFLAGVGAIKWFNQEVDTAITRKLPEATRKIEALENEVATLRKEVGAAHHRLDNTKLAKVAELKEEYACGSGHNVPKDSLFVMTGLIDGTSCNVRNVNFYSQLALQIPKE